MVLKCPSGMRHVSNPELIRTYCRDASWEFGGLYQDLLEEHKHCDAVKCVCPRGRDYVSTERYIKVVSGLQIGPYNREILYLALCSLRVVFIY